MAIETYKDHPNISYPLPLPPSPPFMGNGAIASKHLSLIFPYDINLETNNYHICRLHLLVWLRDFFPQQACFKTSRCTI